MGKKPHENEASYLAFTTIMGGGSWYTDCTPDKAATGLGRTIAEDWGSMFAVEGEKCGIGIYNVTDHQHFTMSHRGVFNKDTEEEIPLLEEREIVIPKRRAR